MSRKSSRTRGKVVFEFNQLFILGTLIQRIGVVYSMYVYCVPSIGMFFYRRNYHYCPTCTVILLSEHFPLTNLFSFSQMMHKQSQIMIIWGSISDYWLLVYTICKGVNSRIGALDETSNSLMGICHSVT
jgi:hypothetical protein